MNLPNAIFGRYSNGSMLAGQFLKEKKSASTKTKRHFVPQSSDVKKIFQMWHVIYF